MFYSHFFVFNDWKDEHFHLAAPADDHPVVKRMAGNPITRARLEAAGCEVIPFPGQEISVKGAGGPTCLTRPLVRA